MVTRREKVLLELEDQFSQRMIKPIAATKALDVALDSLSGTSVQTAREQEKVAKSTKALGDEVDKTSKKTRDGTRDIDRYSGRLRLLTEAAVLLGPALVPIGAVAVPATVALAAGMGAAVASVGVAVLAFKGLGDGLKALNEYQLAPTQKNLQAMRAEMDSLGPAGATFVAFLDSLEPELRSLQQVARAGLFPGVTAGLADMLDLMPQVRLIVFNLATEMGRLSAEAGGALSGAGFSAFFDYLETDAAPTLAAFGHTLGNVAQGLGSLLVAFAPLSRGFSAGMESMSRSFAAWAAGLSQTEGFRDFVAYVRESGPQVLALLGSMATAFIEIVKAAAPVAATVLPALTALAKVLATIAASPIGPPLFTAAAAMLALSRATTMANAAMLKFSGTTAAGAANMAKLKGALNFAAILAGIWAVDAAFDKVFGDRSVDSSDLLKNLTNLGGSDAAAELDKIGLSIEHINRSMLQAQDKVIGFLPGDNAWSEARDNIEDVDKALASLVQDGNADQAAAAMDSIVASAKAQGISVAETTKWFKLYNEALADSKEVDDAAAAQKRYADALSVSSRVLDLTQAKVAGLTARMEEQRASALGAFDAVTQYANALIDARKQAEKSNAGIEISNDMSRKQKLEVIANREELFKLAGAWNNQGDAVRNNMGKWREARQNFIDTATAMGAPIEQARRLADRLLEIPRQRQIDIKLYGSDTAADQIARIRRELESLPKSIRTDYYVNQVNAISRPRGPVQNADGGTVPKTGMSYADRHHYLLADGEEVISNRHGQADRNRELLKAINAGRLADGGTVGKNKPLFTEEGPRWYKKAYKHNRPFAIDGPAGWDWPYQTGLSASLDRAFGRWLADNEVPFDPSARIVDYDMRGFFKKTRGRGWHEGSHFPDTFKTPYDTTFSHESKYATKDNPFFWRGEKLIDTRNGQVVFAADGGSVPKGGAYRDKHLYMLAPGEEIISNRRGQADRFRADRASGRIPGYADGGTAGGKPTKPQFGTFAAVTPSDARDAARALKELTAAAKATSSSLDTQKSKLDDLNSRRDDIRTSIKSGLRSDIFATPAAVNPWESSKPATADPLAALNADNAEITDFLADIETLRGNNVTGAALAEALANPAYADMLANMPTADLVSYQSLYGQREQMLTQAAMAGSAATGVDEQVAAQARVVDQLAAQQREETKASTALTKEVAGIREELKKLRGEAQSGARGR